MDCVLETRHVSPRCGIAFSTLHVPWLVRNAHVHVTRNIERLWQPCTPVLRQCQGRVCVQIAGCNAKMSRSLAVEQWPTLNELVADGIAVVVALAFAHGRVGAIKCLLRCAFGFVIEGG